jgi:hypothetical protein
VVVDIRTWLRGGKIVFQISENRYSVAEFKKLIGDSESVLTYPAWWLLTPEAHQLRQLPHGSTHYMNLKNDIQLLEVL